ncbi:hypothetical protein SISSUDRAFT_969056, partial [Sistotremastrum suecicum HHB10207 ss-3]
EDWDRTTSEEVQEVAAPSGPSTPPSRSQSGIPEQVDETPNTANARRSLTELMKAHAEKGKDLNLSDEDAERLTEELGNWINSDSSPYEPDDDFFCRRSSLDDAALQRHLTANSNPTNARPRGQSESVACRAPTVAA